MAQAQKTDRCKGCGAEIIWIKHKGKAHPVDARPKRVFVKTAPADLFGGDDGYTFMSGHESHFSTCPKADQFRRTSASQEEKA